MNKSELISVGKAIVKDRFYLSFIIIFITAFSLLILLQSFPHFFYEKFRDYGFSDRVILALYHDEPQILFRLGSRYLGEGAYDEKKSYVYLQEAAILDERLPLVHFQLARIYFLRQQYVQALREVNLELKYNPSFPRSYYLRGLIYGYDGQFALAADDFKTFVELKPDEWAGYMDLAWVLFQLGDYEGVRDAMETILATTKNAWLLNAFGLALLNLNQPSEALIALEEAKTFASRMVPEDWGYAYIGNNPDIYGRGLAEMRKNIDENIEKVNNRLLTN